jgi:hypothetical protein
MVAVYLKMDLDLEEDDVVFRAEFQFRVEDA